MSDSKIRNRVHSCDSKNTQSDYIRLIILRSHDEQSSTGQCAVFLLFPLCRRHHVTVHNEKKRDDLM